MRKPLLAHARNLASDLTRPVVLHTYVSTSFSDDRRYHVRVVEFHCASFIGCTIREKSVRFVTSLLTIVIIVLANRFGHSSTHTRCTTGGRYVLLSIINTRRSATRARRLKLRCLSTAIGVQDDFVETRRRQRILYGFRCISLPMPPKRYTIQTYERTWTRLKRLRYSQWFSNKNRLHCVPTVGDYRICIVGTVFVGFLQIKN